MHHHGKRIIDKEPINTALAALARKTKISTEIKTYEDWTTIHYTTLKHKKGSIVVKVFGDNPHVWGVIQYTTFLNNIFTQKFIGEWSYNNGVIDIRWRT